jgi:tungstate transport system substrate-binding protein
MAHHFLKRLRLAGYRLAAAALLAIAGPLAQAAESIVLASTTSTEQSGLFGHILPIFEKESGITVKVVALGTGQALDVGRRGDADALLVHDRPAEDRFVAEGYGAYRRDVMYNDFVVIGPAADPAAVKAAADTADAFRRIAGKGATFISRADRSGTHAAELRFWKAAGVEPVGQGWYKEAGAGMGPTLNMAAGIDAYTLSDRGTWANFGNRQNLAILYAGDPRLFNPYGVILVNPGRHPHVKKEAAEKFIDWLTSDAGRAAITSYRLGGEQLFYPTPR